VYYICCCTIQAIVPVMVKTINEGVTFYGTTYQLTKTVALVRRIEPSNLYNIYTLEDRTGKINGIFRHNGKTSQIPKILLDKYYEIIGSLNNEKTFEILKFETATLNHLNTHNLEVIIFNNDIIPVTFLGFFHKKFKCFF